MEKKPQPRYDGQKRSKANISAVLRFVVAFYLAYLGRMIARNSGGEDTTMEPWVGKLICGVFFVAAIGFGIYSLKRYQADLKAAELPNEEESPPSGGDGEDMFS